MGVGQDARITSNRESLTVNGAEKDSASHPLDTFAVATCSCAAPGSNKYLAAPRLAVRVTPFRRLVIVPEATDLRLS